MPAVLLDTAVRGGADQPARRRDTGRPAPICDGSARSVAGGAGGCPAPPTGRPVVWRARAPLPGPGECSRGGVETTRFATAAHRPRTAGAQPGCPARVAAAGRGP